MKNQKNHKMPALCGVMLISLFLAACDWESVNGYESFDYDLRGTWTSNDPSVFSGTLKIDYDRITISGYSESQSLRPGGNDDQRPFKGFTRGAPLKGYSEKENTQGGTITGTFYIEDAGSWRSGIPYTYWETSSSSDYRRRKFIRFTFGGRQETLERTGD